MVPEDQPVEHILEAIGDIMAPENQPKVLLFDIGGVCVSERLHTVQLRTSVIIQAAVCHVN